MQEKDRFKLGEFWLDKRIDGRSPYWQITWYDPSRRKIRQRSTGTEDFELAQECLAKHYIARGERKREPASGAFIEHALMRYYENHAKNLPSAPFARYAIAHWSRFWIGKTVEQITDEQLEKFKVYLSEGEIHGPQCKGEQCAARGPAEKRSNRRDVDTGCSAWALDKATIRRVLGVGRAALKRAVRKEELASAPPMSGVKVRKKRLYRASREEIAALLNGSASMPWVRKWIIGSLVTCARPTAVLQLCRQQFDFANRLIDLNPPDLETTNKGRPIIPMVQAAYDYISAQPFTGLWITYPTKKGLRPLKSIRQGFERARDRAGLSAQITPYTIRRTIATQLRKRGVPLEEIAGFLGHIEDEFAVTEDYAIYSPDYLGQAAQAIDAYCRELQPLLDFELVHSTCTPHDTAQSGKLESNQVGRLGLEPRTNTLKGSGLPSNISRLKVRR